MFYLAQCRAAQKLLPVLVPVAAALMATGSGCSSEAADTADGRSAQAPVTQVSPAEAVPGDVGPAVPREAIAMEMPEEAEAAAPAAPPPPTLIVAAPEPDPGQETVEEVPEAAACASAGVESQRPPVALMFALDQSGSMVDRGARPFRWNPVTVALKAFFDDPESAGLSAALQLFPKGLGMVTPTFNPICAAETYTTADIPTTTLPDPGVFGTFIDAITPAGGTPTKQALEGVIVQAEALVQASPNTRVAIVLVSDGVPSSCRSSVETTSETVAAVADRFPTYVIGVGDRLENLNAIAAAGGTGSALLVDVADPTLTRQTVLARLKEIRGAVASCDVIIPEPPAGETLDPNKITALILPASGNRLPIPYEQDCATGEGFHYDDPAAPETITLCEKACGQLTSQTASVRVLFGCTLKPGTVK